MQLSDGEKLILLMLADMYKHLKIEGEFDPDFVSHTIYNDHLWGFNRKAFGNLPVDRAEPEPPEVTETENILDMWSFLEGAYEQLSPADKQRIKDETGAEDVKFNGFDANHEQHYGIALYMIERLKIWQRFKGSNLSTVHPLERYKQMYNVFKDIRPKIVDRTMSIGEIVTVLNADKRPG
jgi:uncharacterized protein YfbU (UPF0304 family)